MKNIASLSNLSFSRGSASFSPNSLANLSLWYDSQDSSKLITQGSSQFTAANSESLTVASNASLQTGVSFWVSAWVKIDSKATGIFGLSKDIDIVGAREWVFFYDNVKDNFSFQIFKSPDADGGIVDASNLGAITAGTWYHVLFWYDSVNNVIGIKGNNGTANTAAATSPPQTGAAPFSIGKDGYTGFERYWGGAFQAVAFGKTNSIGTLSATIATALYNSGNGVLYDGITAAQATAWGLVSFWNLTETSGTRKDSYGTNDLTDNNTVTAVVGQATGQPQNNAPIKTVTDKSSLGIVMTQSTFTKQPLYTSSAFNSKASLSFDGINDCLPTGNIGLGAFTIFTVMKLTGTAGIIYEQSAAAATDGFYLQGTLTNTIVAVKSSVESDKKLSSNWAVDNTARITTHVMDGTHAGHLLYINNASQVLTDGTGTSNPGTATTTDVINIGSRNNGASVQSTGYISEFLIYNRALTTSEIGKVNRYLGAKYAITVS